MTGRHKTAALTWIVVYPMITGLLALIEPGVRDLPIPGRTLVLTLIMVPLMVYVAMPAATRLFSKWIADGSDPRLERNSPGSSRELVP